MAEGQEEDVSRRPGDVWHGYYRTGIPPEITLFLDTLRAQIQSTQQDLALLRSNVPVQIESSRQTYDRLSDRLRQEVESKFRAVEKDIEEIKQELKNIRETDFKELQKAVIGNQSENYKRIIAAQWAILLLILSAAVGLLVKILHP